MAPEQFPAETQADVLRARADTIAVLRALGAIVEEARIPFDFGALGTKNGRLIGIEAYAFHRAYIEDARLEIDPAVRKRIVAAKDVSAADYLAARAERERAAAEFAHWMRGRDVLLTRCCRSSATPVAQADEATFPLASFSRAVNYLGACAVVAARGCLGRRAADRDAVRRGAV